MRILIIEDDEHLLRALERGLRDHYLIDGATTGQAGLELLETNAYDTLVLDLSLPDSTGFQICTAIRKAGNSVPILVLTATAEIADKVKMLDAGADDYLVKPFSLVELKARLRALTRRTSPAVSSASMTIADLELDMAMRTVRRQKQEIQLRRKEYDLLEYLMLNRGKTLTRAMILDHVWNSETDIWTNAVDVHIKYLRDKVDRPFAKPLIKTVHGVGYKLES